MGSGGVREAAHSAGSMQTPEGMSGSMLGSKQHTPPSLQAPT